jgi:hypothetical protein
MLNLVPHKSMRSNTTRARDVCMHYASKLTCVREAPCKAWDACMNRDPTLVGRTNVMAETFAGVINSFVDPISWKTMVSALFMMGITAQKLDRGLPW